MTEFVDGPYDKAFSPHLDLANLCGDTYEEKGRLKLPLPGLEVDAAPVEAALLSFVEALEARAK